MTDWTKYITSNDEQAPKRKKPKGSGCKRNKINKNRFGPCIFNEKDECVNCHRPRRKIVKLDPKTGNLIREYLE